MTKLAITLCAVALALTACGSDPEPKTESAKPAAAESSAAPSEPVGAPEAPAFTKSQLVESLGLSKPTEEYKDWGEWTYTTSKGVTCGVEQILIGADKVALYASAGDTVANNGDAGLVLVGDPYGEADDGGYAVTKACFDELNPKMLEMAKP